jgi:hypothetical protein
MYLKPSHYKFGFFPNKRNVTPRYQQPLNKEDRHHKFKSFSPNPEDAGVWIHQDAWFHLGEFDKTVLFL